MTKSIFLINIIIIILEFIVFPCIVRWINVNNINLSSVGIGKLRECGKIVALDNEVVGSVQVIGDYWVDFIVVALDEDRKVFPQTFLNILGFFFPYKPVLLMSSYEFEQRVFFLVAQSLKGLYFSSQFCFIHGTSGCLKSALIGVANTPLRRVNTKKRGYLYRC